MFFFLIFRRKRILFVEFRHQRPGGHEHDVRQQEVVQTRVVPGTSDIRAAQSVFQQVFQDFLRCPGDDHVSKPYENRCGCTTRPAKSAYTAFVSLGKIGRGKLFFETSKRRTRSSRRSVDYRLGFAQTSTIGIVARTNSPTKQICPLN